MIITQITFSFIFVDSPYSIALWDKPKYCESQKSKRGQRSTTVKNRSTKYNSLFSAEALPQTRVLPQSVPFTEDVIPRCLSKISVPIHPDTTLANTPDRVKQKGAVRETAMISKALRSIARVCASLENDKRRIPVYGSAIGGRT